MARHSCGRLSLPTPFTDRILSATAQNEQSFRRNPIGNLVVMPFDIHDHKDITTGNLARGWETSL